MKSTTFIVSAVAASVLLVSTIELSHPVGEGHTHLPPGGAFSALSANTASGAHFSTTTEADYVEPISPSEQRGYWSANT